MLRRRPTDSFKLVSIHDEAMDHLSDRVVRAYTDSDRDWSVIAPEIATMTDKPAVFVCDPLRPAYDAASVTGAVADLKAIFAAHVRGIDSAGPGNEPKMIDKGDRIYVDMGYVDSLPLAIVVDIASEIIRRGLGDTNPFMPPDTYWRQRARRAVRLHARDLSTIAHMTETAKNPEGNM